MSDFFIDCKQTNQRKRIDDLDFVRAFKEQVDAYARNCSDDKNADLIVLPFRHSRTGRGEFDENVSLVAHPRNNNWKASSHRLGVAAIVQGVSSSVRFPLEIVCGDIDHSTAAQADRILSAIFAPAELIEPARPLFEQFSPFPVIQELKTPAALRPLQLYSVTGGKLAQLLL